MQTRLGFNRKKIGAKRYKTKFLVPADFVPLPHQRDFFYSRAFKRWLIGGQGCGKSCSLGVDCLRMAVANGGKDHDGFIVAPIYSMLVRVTFPAFARLLPAGIIRQHHRSHRFIELINGSKIWIGSASEPDTLEGSNLCWAAMDECRMIDKRAYQFLLARVRIKGAQRPSVVGVSTPDDNGWLEASTMDDDSEVIFATSRDNVHLIEGYAEGLEGIYSAEDTERFVGGRFTKSSGSIYKDWSDELNTLDYTWSVNNAKLYCTIDFGYNMPAALWIAQIKDGNDYIDVVIDELVPDKVTAKRFAEMILERNREAGYVVEQYYGDVAGDHIRGDGLSDISDFAGMGIGVSTISQPIFRDIIAGLSVVRGRICTAKGVRRLFASRDLMDRYRGNMKMPRGFCKDIAAYRYPDKLKAGQAQNKPCPRLNTRCEHTMDAVRYYLVQKYPNMAVSSDFSTFKPMSTDEARKNRVHQVEDNAHDFLYKRGFYDDMYEMF